MPFDALFVPPALREAVSDRAWVAAMIEAERALAAAQERLGTAREGTAAAIAAAGPFDPDELAEDGQRVGNLAEPLVRRLREKAPDAHRGATSQDVADTAAMLVARAARTLVLAELDGASAACARLAEQHRATVMPARTLLQQALPTTFGLKAAGWLVGFVEARRRLAGVRLQAQLGGAGGTLAAFGRHGLETVRLYAEELGLDEPLLPWHTRRDAVAELAFALDRVGAAAAKVALDVQLLAQTEVGEVREAAGGGSSTIPHKRNAVGSTLARACATGVHAAAGLLTGGVHEHERAGGDWHAEWRALSEALALAGGAAWWIRRGLDGLEVDGERMRANLGADTLSEAERFAPDAAGPDDYLGSAAELVDRALARYREGT